MKFLLILIFLLIYNVPLAQNRSEIIGQSWAIACGHYKVIADVLAPYREIPFITGRMSQGNVIFFLNKETGTWSFLLINEKIACGIVTGKQIGRASCRERV